MAALAGAIVGPGLHTIAGAVSNSGTLTLDAGGDPDAAFVFQVGGAMAMAAGSRVVLAGGARVSRVFWQVDGAGAVGANASFVGTLMALDAVAVGNGTVVNGRLLARNGALTLDANELFAAPPAVTHRRRERDHHRHHADDRRDHRRRDGRAAAVTVGGEDLTALVQPGGDWNITPSALDDGAHTVVATVRDPAENAGTDSQELELELDTTAPAPALTISGGDGALSDDATPEISGTADVAPGTNVTVTIGNQTMTTLVQADGGWNATPAPVGVGTWPVDATS